MHSSYIYIDTALPIGQPTFVIAVRDYWDCSLEKLEEKYKGKIIIERLPETYNPRYIGTDEYEEHILQPAFVTRTE
jgi:hypothetical protein